MEMYSGILQVMLGSGLKIIIRQHKALMEKVPLSIRVTQDRLTMETINFVHLQAQDPIVVLDMDGQITTMVRFLEVPAGGKVLLQEFLLQH